VKEKGLLLERLRQRRWRMTPQRRVIAEVLAGEHVHLAADEVHARAAARLPEISRATVYNTLNELVKLGEVLEVSPDGGTKRYDPNTTDPHQHLVCDRCGAIRDVYPDGHSRLKLPARERHGFVIKSVAIVFRGLCPGCASKRDSQSTPRRLPRSEAR
jgi:Fur family ferric uptake transcriptional regulator